MNGEGHRRPAAAGRRGARSSTASCPPGRRGAGAPTRRNRARGGDPGHRVWCGKGDRGATVSSRAEALRRTHLFARALGPFFCIVPASMAARTTELQALLTQFEVDRRGRGPSGRRSCSGVAPSSPYTSIGAVPPRSSSRCWAGCSRCAACCSSSRHRSTSSQRTRWAGRSVRHSCAPCSCAWRSRAST